MPATRRALRQTAAACDQVKHSFDKYGAVDRNTDTPNTPFSISSLSSLPNIKVSSPTLFPQDQVGEHISTAQRRGRLLGPPQKHSKQILRTAIQRVQMAGLRPPHVLDQQHLIVVCYDLLSEDRTIPQGDRPLHARCRSQVELDPNSRNANPIAKQRPNQILQSEFVELFSWISRSSFCSVTRKIREHPNLACHPALPTSLMLPLRAVRGVPLEFRTKAIYLISQSRPLWKRSS